MTIPRQLIEAFENRLRADLEAVRGHNGGRVAVHSFGGEAERWAAALARVDGAAADLEHGGIGGYGERIVFRATGDAVADALAVDLAEIAAALAGDAAALAELVIPDASIRRAVLVASAPELAAVWPEPDRDRWPVWRAVPIRFDAVYRLASPHGEKWRERYGPALAAVLPPEVRAGAGVYASVTLRAIDGTVRLSIPPGALPVLYHAERDELWRTRATFAAGEAFAEVRALAAATNPGPAHFEAVERALAHAEGNEPDPLAAVALADTGRRSQYAGELLTAAASVALLFEGEPPATEDEARATVETTHGPALRWDADFANVLEGMGGPVAAELAGKVRTKAAELAAAALNPVIPGTPPPVAGGMWLLWAELAPPPAPRWLRVLARVLWADKWRPALVDDAERERRRGMYGSVSILPLAVNRAVTGLMDARRTGDIIGEQLILFGVDRREIGRVELARVDVRIHARLVELLAEAPPAVDALFTFALRGGFERWREVPRDGLGDGQLLIEGGKRGLSVLLGCNEKDADYALTWGQQLTLPDIDVKGLWTWHGTYIAPRPGRGAVGMLTIQQALLPKAEQKHKGKGRYFAPWTAAPPLPADRTQRGPALHFWRLLGVKLAEIAAAGKLRAGRAILSGSVLESIGKQAGEPRWRERLRDWTDAGALDEASDGWRYGRLYAAEQKVLEDSQRVENKAAKGGRARAEKAERARDGTMKRRPKKE